MILFLRKKQLNCLACPGPIKYAKVIWSTGHGMVQFRKNLMKKIRLLLSSTATLQETLSAGTPTHCLHAVLAYDHERIASNEVTLNSFRPFFFLGLSLSVSLSHSSISRQQTGKSKTK